MVPHTDEQRFNPSWAASTRLSRHTLLLRGGYKRQRRSGEGTQAQDDTVMVGYAPRLSLPCISSVF